MFFAENKDQVVDKRIDMVYLFDVKNGNPNGDPDCDNAPRMDEYTGKGYTTDVCMKSKIRRYILNKYNNDNSGNNLYITPGACLERLYKGVRNEVCEENDIGVKEYEKSPKKFSGDIETDILTALCKSFFDIRAFGAVVTQATTEGMDGGITGPVSMQFANSVETIRPMELTITRCCGSTEKDATHTMGSKQIIPYGLYVGTVSVDPNRAKQTGFTYGDLHELLCALRYMMDCDRHASKGMQSVRKVFMFAHSNTLGNCDFSDIEECVEVKRVNEKDVENDIPASKYSDYSVSVNKSAISDKITVYNVEREDEDVVITEI